MSNALTTKPAAGGNPLSNIPMMNPDTFDHMYRVGKMMGMSPLFPDHLRRGGQEAAIANGMLVVNMAMRLNEDPLTVAQQIYFVGGKPGWNTTYMIARANQSGVFQDQIDWEISGKGGDNLSVTAFATLSGTGRKVSVNCDMAMAKAEGWTSNKKYQTIPEQMLRYRSAAFLIRLYAPEVMIGVPAAIEVELAESEFRDVTPPQEQPAEPEPEKEQPKTTSKRGGGARKAPAKDAQKAPDESEVTDAAPEDGEDAEYKRLESAAEDVINDIRDAPSVDSALEFHAEVLARMKKVAPDLHAWITKEAKTAREAEAEGDDEGGAPQQTGRPKQDYTPDEKPADDSWARQMVATIKTDLADCVGGEAVDEVLDVYGAEVSKMKDKFPEHHAEVMEKVEERRDAG
ncbi:hypothetical protein [Sediminimonas sp.]|uniref:hypothetical protein n=1 Tax=Sediminimonas sp. TaxID=2823379 RepID=UPI0025ED8B98|nr:hypothetical protein [Sediminimonas sp.]